MAGGDRINGGSRAYCPASHNRRKAENLMVQRDLSGVASFAAADGEAKLFAPSAARNVAPLAELLVRIAPPQGRALEIASGTGQHIVEFAARLPGLHWQPTEIDPLRRAAIDARGAETGLANLAPVIALDAARPGWGKGVVPCDLIVLSNLLHLISTPEAATLIREAANALAPRGTFMIYGPFMRGGDLTSEGDQSFHNRLTAEDPDIGYKDDFDTMDMLQDSGLEMAEVVEMPANNLALLARRP